MGEKMADMIKTSAEPKSGEEPVVDWVTVKSYNEVKNGLDKRKY